MRPLSTAELLTTWERGLAGDPTERALLLLASSYAPATPDELARLPVGHRDRRLLRLRERTFGSRLVSEASCPQCGERLEMSFSVGDVTVGDDEASADGGDTVPLQFHLDEYEIELRLPDSRDLRDLRELGESGEAVAEGRRWLIERCVLSARRRGRKVAAQKLPEHVIRTLAEHLAKADPQAALELDLTCPSCSHRWQSPFDVVTFFWTEIDAWARRLLRDVHTLARFYGWNEDEILSLSSLRRQCYLEMVGP